MLHRWLGSRGKGHKPKNTTGRLKLEKARRQSPLEPPEGTACRHPDCSPVNYIVTSELKTGR